MRKSDYDVWYDKYQPEIVESLETDDKSPKMYETYGEDWEIIRNTNPRKVWTLLDCDGELYLSHGIHYVNRLNYFICKNEWDDNERDYKY